MKLDKNINYKYDATERRKVGEVDKRLRPSELSNRIAYDLWLALVGGKVPHGDNLVKQLRFRMKDIFTNDEVCLEAMEELIEAGYLRVERNKVSFCPYGFHRNSMEELEADVPKNRGYGCVKVSFGPDFLDEDGKSVSQYEIVNALKRIKCIQYIHHVTPHWAPYYFDLARKAGIPCDGVIDNAPLLPDPENKKPKLIDVTSIHA